MMELGVTLNGVLKLQFNQFTYIGWYNFNSFQWKRKWGQNLQNLPECFVPNFNANFGILL